MSAPVVSNCGCGQYRGHPDAQSCAEIAEHGRTPIIRPGDVLDGVIVVGGPLDSVMVGDPDFMAFGCECFCHEAES